MPVPGSKLPVCPAFRGRGHETPGLSGGGCQRTGKPKEWPSSLS